MNRREFLRTSVIASDHDQKVADSSSGSSLRSNGGLIRTLAGLEPYTGEWNTITASHLLRRTMIGPRRQEVLEAAAGTLDSLLTQLFSPLPIPQPPPDPNVPGRDWANGPYDDISNVNYQYDEALQRWWMGLMVGQGVSIIERMVLFWHNHFATESAVVGDARFMYRQNALFHQYAIGNIRDLAKEVTVDPAMLHYLNGYLNRIPNPDENYARELQELFTIGKGPQVGLGDYTTYTEDDVKAAARVLTGWTARHSDAPPQSVFVQRNHDTTDKVFSPAYQNTTIQTVRNPDGSIDGRKEIDALIDMIFNQEATAQFLCRKLYRWFVYYEIDDAAEQNVIGPLATIMRQNNYELKPVLDSLFRSAHFFDMNNVGCVIKNPVELVAASVRQLNVPMPDPVSGDSTDLLNLMVSQAAGLQMELLAPPNVAGWPAYHQVPDFYELWINTTTLPLRGRFTDSLVNGLRARTTGTKFPPDLIAYAKGMSAPEDPFRVVNDIAFDLLPPINGGTPLSPAQRDYILYSVLELVRNDEYEWSAMWAKATADPPDAMALKLVSDKLATLLKFMMRMASFQLT